MKVSGPVSLAAASHISRGQPYEGSEAVPAPTSPTPTGSAQSDVTNEVFKGQLTAAAAPTGVRTAGKQAASWKQLFYL